mmetsp:Transcript_27954/g.52913  ORF Transcript_27954/g.52913 Transcript_27954/m.52913 type:complete len:544 (+) Transcript_27954:1-1632(+)
MLFEFCRGIDSRKWEPRPSRKSVGAQVTWGVRFETNEEAAKFITDLAGEVSSRMQALKVQGRSISLKVLRAVLNAPEGARKGHIGHGICDNYTRTVTLPTYTDQASLIAREATKMLRDLQVEANQIRGAGIQVTRLDSDPASKSVAGRPLKSRIAAAPVPTVFDPKDPPRWVQHYALNPPNVAQQSAPSLPAGDSSTGTSRVYTQQTSNLSPRGLPAQEQHQQQHLQQPSCSSSPTTPLLVPSSSRHPPNSQPDKGPEQQAESSCLNNARHKPRDADCPTFASSTHSAPEDVPAWIASLYASPSNSGARAGAQQSSLDRHLVTMTNSACASASRRKFEHQSSGRGLPQKALKFTISSTQPEEVSLAGRGDCCSAHKPSLREITQDWFSYGEDIGLQTAKLSASLAVLLRQDCESVADKFEDAVSKWAGVLHTSDTLISARHVCGTNSDSNSVSCDSRQSMEALGVALLQGILDWIVEHRSVGGAKRLLRFAGNLALTWDALPLMLKHDEHPAAALRAICEKMEMEVGEWLLDWQNRMPSADKI